MNNYKNNRKRTFLFKTNLNKSKIMGRVMLLGILALLLFFNVSGLNAQLCVNQSVYNSCSWTWSYAGPCSSQYNCLSYALGITSSWIWPWGGCPTSSQVDTYLATQGYYTTGDFPKIISYGSSSSCIVHFGKVTSSTTITAKWGSLNLLNHGSWNPYYSGSCYGSMQSVYYQRVVPMSVSISGPSKGYNTGTYTWCANTSNGTPPYTYSWEYKYASYSYQPWPFTTQCITVSLPLDFDLWIKATVTGADGKKVSAEKFIINLDALGLKLGATLNSNQISTHLSDLLNEAEAKGIISSNPYDYINNESFRKIVKLGPEALMTIRSMIRESDENGLKEYILAIAAEEIAKTDLKGDHFGWENGKKWTQQWDFYMRSLSGKVAEIFKSGIPVTEKNKALVKLGIPAIPLIIDEIARGNSQYKVAIQDLLKGYPSLTGLRAGEDVKSWETKNSNNIRVLRDLINIYRKK
ncbi:MAG: hypothetical protein ACM3SY_14225 [Candidatus Omnitrophota bacterium]